MPLLNTNPTTTAAWKLLGENFKETKSLQLKDLFASRQGTRHKIHIKISGIYC